MVSVRGGGLRADSVVACNDGRLPVVGGGAAKAVGESDMVKLTKLSKVDDVEVYHSF